MAKTIIKTRRNKQMFQGLLNLVVLIFALFAFDRLDLINADMTESIEASKENQTAKADVAPTTAVQSVKFTDRIAAKNQATGL